jgi:hypothetical protein
VRLSAWSGETKGLIVAFANGRIYRELELDGSIELRIEFDLADLAM